MVECFLYLLQNENNAHIKTCTQKLFKDVFPEACCNIDLIGCHGSMTDMICVVISRKMYDLKMYVP